jgi:cytochrome c oxidase cbb3-type subunit 3
MRLNKFINVVLAALMLSPSIGFAAASTNNNGQDYNWMLISLVSLMIILLFVIWVLANTLRQLGFVVRDKMRKEKDEKAGIAISILLFLLAGAASFHAKAAEVAADAAQKAPAVVSNVISGIQKDDFYAIITIISLELLIVFALVFNIKTLLRAISEKPEAEIAVAKARKSWFWDKFNAAATLEQEKDILLDHNYDGIQELDNSLPPWWKYGFYLTIIVGIIYLYRYHVSHEGMSQTEEYVAEMKQGEDDKAAYLAQSANNVDENTVVYLSDAAEIAQGKDIFSKNCISCHLADGGGSVGPNLTDEFWLHGGGIKDIFKTIKYGWQEKGMKSWKDDFSPKQIQQVASFVKSLKGSHPAAPKAPQGDIYIEASGAKAPTADTTKMNK